jgi:hypothetical protein
MKLKELTIKVAFLCSIAVISIGCSQTPRVNINEFDSQDIGLVAKHWRNLARQTAKNVAISEGNKFNHGGSVYVAPGNTDSAFDKAFRDYLISAFSENGITISKRSSKANTVLNFKAETYLYTDKDKEKSPIDKKSFWAFLYKFTGDWKDMSRDSREISLISLGMLWDVMEAQNKTTDAEVILTVTIEDFDTVKYKKSTEFYINRNDLMLYWSDKAPYPNQNTTENQSNDLFPNKSIEVTKK